MTLTPTPPWEDFLRSHFPGYLLPESHRQGIDAASAARFLEHLTQRPDQLRLLLLASLFAARMDALRDFSRVHLPELVRTLHARTEVHARTWEGGYQGRLDVRATLAHHLNAGPTRFVTRARRRRFDLPEQILLRATVRQLVDELTRLRLAGVTASYGWSQEASAHEGNLRHLLASTVLREIPEERPGAFHLKAAAMARHEGYTLARSWFLWLDEVESIDPERRARLLAEGALVPLEDHTRFELAVAVRLLQALEARLVATQPGRWHLERTAVLPGRAELATLLRDDGARLRLFYNQSELDAGAVEAGTRHYLGHTGRMRPDLTLRLSRPGAPERAVVVEIKHSSRTATLLEGFHEAHLYRLEYGAWLTGWPQAVLVSSGAIPGTPRREDPVVAVDWARWVPDEVVDGMLEGL